MTWIGSHHLESSGQKQYSVTHSCCKRRTCVLIEPTLCLHVIQESVWVGRETSTPVWAELPFREHQPMRRGATANGRPCPDLPVFYRAVGWPASKRRFAPVKGKGQGVSFLVFGAFGGYEGQSNLPPPPNATWAVPTISPPRRPGTNGRP